MKTAHTLNIHNPSLPSYTSTFANLNYKTILILHKKKKKTYLRLKFYEDSYDQKRTNENLINK